MRKLIVKYLALYYIKESNIFQILSEILLYISIAAIIVQPLIGLCIFVLSAILYSIGLLRPTVKTSRPRASTILFPLLAGSGYLLLMEMENIINGNWYIIPLIFFGIFILLTFVYLDRLVPVKWEELDDSQKLQYAEFHSWAELRDKLTPEEFNEYMELSKLK